MGVSARDSYDDYLASQGGGSVTADDSYEEYLRQKRQVDLAGKRAASRQPAPTPFRPVGPPAPQATAGGVISPSGALLPSHATGRGTAGSWDLGAGGSPDAPAPGLAEQLAIGHESPSSFGEVLEHPIRAAMGAGRALERLAGTLFTQPVEHPVETTKFLGKAAVTAPGRALGAVGDVGARALSSVPGLPEAVSRVSGLPPRAADEAPSYLASAGKEAGALFDIATLTAPLTAGASTLAGKGAGAMYAAAADEARFGSALERARQGAMAARQGRAANAAGAAAAERILPPGQYDMPRPQGLPRLNLLPPTEQERVGSAWAAGIPAGGEPPLTATPQDVEVYRRMRDQGIGAGGREIGRARPLPGESYADYETRAGGRQAFAEQTLERNAIQGEGADLLRPESPTTKSGRLDLGGMGDAELKREYARLNQLFGEHAGQVASFEEHPAFGQAQEAASRSMPASGRRPRKQGLGNVMGRGTGRFVPQSEQDFGGVPEEAAGVLLEAGLPVDAFAQHAEATKAAAQTELELGRVQKELSKRKIDHGEALQTGLQLGGTEAGPLAMIVGTGVGAGVGAAAAPPGHKTEGAAMGAIAALGLVAVGAGLARDGSAAVEAEGAAGRRLARSGGVPIRDPFIEEMNRPLSDEEFQQAFGRPRLPRAPAPEEAPPVVVPMAEHLAMLDRRDAARALEPGQVERRRTGAIGGEPKEPGTEVAIPAEQREPVPFPESLYSRSQRAIEGAPFKKGTAEQWTAALAKGVSADERAALAPFLEANKGKVLTREQVLEAHDATRIRIGEKMHGGDEPTSRAPARYESYVVPGEKRNYREAVLTLERPTTDRLLTWRSSAEPHEPAFRADTPEGDSYTINPLRQVNQYELTTPDGGRVQGTLEHVQRAAEEQAPDQVSFRVTPELREKVRSGGQPIGATREEVVRAIGLAGAGAVAGGLTGSTPAERRRNMLVGGLAGLGLAAVGGRLAKGASEVAEKLGGRELSLGERAELGAEASMERPMTSPKDAADAIAQSFTPASRSSQAQTTASVLRAHRGAIEHEAAIAQATLERISAKALKLPIGKKLGFIDQIEAGAKQADAARQPIANTIRRLLDEERDRIRGMGTGALDNFLADYFPHLWQDPAKAGSWLAQILGTRPFEGSKSFLKHRTVPTVLDGMFPHGVPRNLETMSNAEVLAENARQGGLVPVTFDPVEATMLKLREMKKYRMAREVITDLDARGLSVPAPSGERTPTGYARVTHDWAFGQRAYPEAVARILNNHLGPGIENRAFKAYQALGNTLNQAQLGLSAFHAGMTTVETMVSQMALGIEKMAAGRVGEGLREFVTSPIAPVANYRRGEALLKAYTQPGAALDPGMRAIVEQMAEAGGRPYMKGHDAAIRAFGNAMEAKQYARAGRKLIPAMLERSTGVVLNHLVPRQKLGVFSDLAQWELERLGPNAAPDEVRLAVQKAWDSVDNRLGQVVYDNLFWNRTAKDLLHASVRSVGWNWGTLRELGGGGKDLASWMKGLATGKNPELSHRAAYAIALPITVGMLGAVTQYLYTGKGPETLEDYFHPRTGTKDADGNDNRVQLPTYMRDVFAWSKHPVQTPINKMNPLLSMAADMLENKDYYGDQIRNPDDPVLTQLRQTATFAGKESMPFVVQNIVEGRRRGMSIAAAAPAYVGITPASREVIRTKAQNMMAEISARRRPELTPEEAHASQVRADLRQTLKTKGLEAAKSDLSKALREGTLTRTQVQNLLRDDQTPGIVRRFKGLALADAERVYAAGNARERAMWGPVLQGKRARAAGLR